MKSEINLTETIFQDRLKKFQEFPEKHIIYGGDFGGDLAIHFMDKVFGTNGYKIYASILPCYPNELKNYIKNKLGNRNNVIYFDGGDFCEPEVENDFVVAGVCSSLKEFVNKENKITVEVCGCFFEPDSLRNYVDYHSTEIKNTQISRNGWWFKRIISKKEIRYYVYLFADFKPTFCEELAYNLSEDKHHWSWWRIHACHSEVGVDKVTMNEREKRRKNEMKIVPNRVDGPSHS